MCKGSCHGINKIACNLSIITSQKKGFHYEKSIHWKFHPVIKCSIFGQKILESFGAEVTFWDNNQTFTPSDNLIDDLIQAAHQHDAGVFILGKDDQIINPDNKDIQYIPRDNVMIEAGMFMGVLGKKSVALCIVPGTHEASDFTGINKILYDERNFEKLESGLKKWFDENVKERHSIMKGNNVLMLPRYKIQEYYTIDKRLHISDKLYKQIRHIRIMNFASNLVVNPEIGEIGHIPSKDIHLSDAIEKIMQETNADIELILTQPNKYNLKDLETKVANLKAGSSKGTLYSAFGTLYKNLTSDTIYAKHSSSIPVSFHLYVMKTSMPFGIFNVEFQEETRNFNHVKVDLYSAALDNEDSRRSFVIWQDEDPENYQFFVDNFTNIKKSSILCEKIRLDMLKKWANEWENLKRERVQ